MAKISDPTITRRVLQTAAALQNFDLDSLSLYTGLQPTDLVGILFENESFFERRPTHGRTHNAGGRWLVHDHVELLLYSERLIADRSAAKPATKPAIPKATPSKTAQPKTTQPKTAQPKTAQPKTTEPEAAKSEPTKVEADVVVEEQATESKAAEVKVAEVKVVDLESVAAKQVLPAPADQQGARTASADNTAAASSNPIEPDEESAPLTVDLSEAESSSTTA